MCSIICFAIESQSQWPEESIMTINGLLSNSSHAKYVCIQYVLWYYIHVCACFLRLEIAIHRLFQPSNGFPRRVCNEHVLGQRAFRICVGHGAQIKITLIGYLHSIRQRIFERKGASGFIQCAMWRVGTCLSFESWFLGWSPFYSCFFFENMLR